MNIREALEMSRVLRKELALPGVPFHENPNNTLIGAALIAVAIGEVAAAVTGGFEKVCAELARGRGAL